MSLLNDNILFIMLVRSWRIAVVFAFASFLLAISFVTTAQAQKIERTPAEQYITSPGGVDMRTGRYAYSKTDLVAGEGDSLFLLERQSPDYATDHANPYGNFTHNWDIWLVETRVNLADSGQGPGADYRINVHMNGRSTTFDSRAIYTGYSYSGFGPIPLLTYSGDRASASTVYTYRTPEGALLTFRPIGANDCAGSGHRCAFVSSMVKPDGTRFDFTYASSGQPTYNKSRLARVSSSRGYQLIFEGAGNKVTKVCLIDARNTTPPSSLTCPSTALASTTYVYETGGLARLLAVNDAVGQQWKFSYSGADSTFEMGFFNPSSTSPWLVNNITWVQDEDQTPQEVTYGQRFADGQSYTYQFNRTPSVSYPPYGGTIMGGTYTDNLGAKVYVTYRFPIKPGSRPGDGCVFNCPLPSPDDFQHFIYQPTPGPSEITDPLNRTTQLNYCDPIVEAGLSSNHRDRCAVVPMVSYVDAEGAKITFEYDGYNNVLELRKSAKPGSAAPDLVQTFTYGDCFTEPASCRKPLTEVDANGGQTKRTYASGHGGLLSQMKPAPAMGGRRPLALVTWSQRYSWTKNTSGVLVQSVTPIWMKASETQCQTIAATDPPATCDPTAPQIVTTYEYGAVGTADTLLLKGVAVSSGGLTRRTCYQYDDFGRKIGETFPLAGLASCP